MNIYTYNDSCIFEKYPKNKKVNNKLNKNKSETQVTWSKRFTFIKEKVLNSAD